MVFLYFKYVIIYELLIGYCWYAGLLTDKEETLCAFAGVFMYWFELMHRYGSAYAKAMKEDDEFERKKKE